MKSRVSGTTGIAGRWGRFASSRRLLAVGGVLLAALSGCDSASFTPPRPAELGGGASPSPGEAAIPAASVANAAARSRVVEMILSQPVAPDRFYLVQMLRRDTGEKRYAFRLKAPETSQPFTGAQMADAIRKAAASSAGALIVEPVDTPEVRQALVEAQGRGLPVVVLDEPLPSGSPEKPFPYVTVKGFAEGAARMVSAVSEDARPFRFPPEAGIVVLENRRKEIYSQRRLDAITTALKDAGLKHEVLGFEGERTGAFEALVNYLKTHRVSMVFADDEFGVSGAIQIAMDRYMKHQRAFLIGGFASFDARLDSYAREGAVGLVNRNTDGYARALLQLALDLMDRKPVPERTEVAMPFIHTPPPYKPTDLAVEPEPAEAVKAAPEPASKPSPKR